MSPALKKIQDFKYQLLTDMLSQCTTKQVEFFNQMYPNGIKKIKNFDWAIQQVERPIEKNEQI